MIVTFISTYSANQGDLLIQSPVRETYLFHEETVKIIHIAMIVWIALKLVPLLFFKYIVNPMLFVQTINKVHPLFHFIMQLSQNHFVSIHFKMIQKGIIMPHSIQVEEKTVNGVTLIVRTAGLDNDGELILFLHGFPENATMWDPALIHMAKKGYRCIAPTNGVTVKQHDSQIFLTTVHRIW